jgi:hypothetical protein
MPEEQQTIAGYKGKVQEPGEFKNPNEGKPPLNEDDEYVLQLIALPRVVHQKQEKEKKDGTKHFEDVDMAFCDFEEKTTKNIVSARFRIDKLNYSDEDKYRSGVLNFFHKIGHDIPEHTYPDWTQYFIVGMRFRSRIKIGYDKTPTGVKVVNGRFWLDGPTCRKLLASDTAGEDFQTPAQLKPDASLANALLLAKGAKDGHEALNKLKQANATKELTMAFFNADLEGKVTYPI